MLRFVLLLLVLAAGLLPAAASARVPSDWAGVMLGYDPLIRSPAPALRSEFDVMKANNVARVRIPFYWHRVQPYPRMEQVPADRRLAFVDVEGIPTDFSATDRIVEYASRRGIGVLPVVIGSPLWAAAPNPGGVFAQPRRAGDYARYLVALARRYGSDGTFWDEHPGIRRQPIRDWQIWNEPNLSAYWRPPFAKGYVALLRASRRALRATDPSARIVTAGLTSTSWDSLGKLYRAGARGTFDAVALNTFAAAPRTLLRVLSLTRIIQRRHRNVTPILMTEITWDASRRRTRFRYPWSTTERDQARKLGETFRLLAKVRREYRIEGVFWFAWLTAYRDRDPFDYSGLRVWRGANAPGSKPALAAFRQVVAEVASDRPARRDRRRARSAP